MSEQMNDQSQMSDLERMKRKILKDYFSVEYVSFSEEEFKKLSPQEKKKCGPDPLGGPLDAWIYRRSINIKPEELNDAIIIELFKMFKFQNKANNAIILIKNIAIFYLVCSIIGAIAFFMLLAN